MNYEAVRNVYVVSCECVDVLNMLHWCKTCMFAVCILLYGLQLSYLVCQGDEGGVI